MRVEGRGRIDRSKPVSFTFDGRTVAGFAGDTVASALLGRDIRLMGRSFKYHRPRGRADGGQRGTERACPGRARARDGAERAGDRAGDPRGAGGHEPEPPRPARPRPDGGQRPSLALPRRGLLLQDLHVAPELLGRRLRADHPPRRRPRAYDAQAVARGEREGLRLLRPPRDRRRTRGPDGRADGGAGGCGRDPRRGERRVRRQASFRCMEEIDGKPATLWIAEMLAALPIRAACGS
jgi:hypothetical protein